MGQTVLHKAFKLSRNNANQQNFDVPVNGNIFDEIDDSFENVNDDFELDDDLEIIDFFDELDNLDLNAGN